MPELPEVETVVRTLRGPLQGHTIARTQVERPDVVAGGPSRLARGVSGRTIQGVERRAKNILIHLGEAPAAAHDDAHAAASPERGSILRVHLGMTGKLLFFPPRARAASPYRCVRFRLEGGGSLVYDDVRRFGGVEVLSTEAWSVRERALGPEPLDPAYGPGDLYQALQTSRSPTRSWLLDGRRIAGVGNIYANEALFLAGVHPMRPANLVTREEAARLYEGLRATLARAIELGGTTLRDYVDADGNRGQFAENLAVYGREGRDCLECGHGVDRIVFGGRSAFLCTECQV